MSFINQNDIHSKIPDAYYFFVTPSKSLSLLHSVPSLLPSVYYLLVKRQRLLGNYM